MRFFMQPRTIPFKLAALMGLTSQRMIMECIEHSWHPQLAFVRLLTPIPNPNPNDLVDNVKLLSKSMSR